MLIVFCIIIPIIDDLIFEKKLSFKTILKRLLYLLIGIAYTLLLQFMILVIKAGYFDGENHIMSLASTFMYAIEYDIALIVLVYTTTLIINREKGDNKVWISQQVGGSSQTSMMQSQKSFTKNLNKNQRNKIRLLIFKTYLIQIGAFLLVMILPFLLGKVFEFLVMYFSFAIVRYILGFKYSLHFKKEAICISVSVLIFGIMSLVVPFFFVNLIGAIVFGIALAILLHLSYKYRGMFLFIEASNTERYAELYVLLDGDISEKHIKTICYSRGIRPPNLSIVCDFMQKNKLAYLATKYNYSNRSICYIIDDAIEILRKSA